MELEKMFADANKGIKIDIPTDLGKKIYSKARLIDRIENTFFTMCALITVILLIDPALLGNLIPLNNFQNFTTISSMPMENTREIVFNPLKITFFSSIVAGTIPPLFYFFLINRKNEEIKIEN